MKNLNELLNEMENLCTDDLRSVANKIFQMLKQVEGEKVNTSHREIIHCRKCSSPQIIKFGKDKNGNQRYKCSSCGSTFTSTSFSVISHSHCSFNTWEKYIELLLEGASLAKCAAACCISTRTAFIWRHKILNVLQRDQENRLMNGIVETDDMFFSVSYKGNHKNSSNFIMPRPAYKRGTDNKAPISQMACVMCACERKGHAYAEVLGVGQANDAMLSHAFNKRLLEETIVVSDKAHNFKKFFGANGIELVQTAAHAVPKNPNSPPQIKGVYHIQNVNNLHNRFRKFIRAYNGVATKYLNHYVNLYIWIENHKKSQVSLAQNLHDVIITQATYLSAKAILDLPALPSVA